MDTVVQHLMNWNQPQTSRLLINQSQYQQWQRSFTMDALQGISYGRSFCQHFEIMDFRLWAVADPASCDRIIRQEYLQ